MNWYFEISHDSVRSINQFIDINAWDEVALYIRARGSCVKPMLIWWSNLTYKKQSRKQIEVLSNHKDENEVY